jgi:probable phosphoglycerate mutase
MLARIYLIRHGETECSISGRHTGHTDVPLAGHGENAARELGQRLHDSPFAPVLTSPRQPARQTCELAGLPPVAEMSQTLAEWDYGATTRDSTQWTFASRITRLPAPQHPHPCAR